MFDGQAKDAIFIEVPPSDICHGILPRAPPAATMPAVPHLVRAKEVHEGGRCDVKRRCDCPQREEKKEEG